MSPMRVLATAVVVVLVLAVSGTIGLIGLVAGTAGLGLSSGGTAAAGAPSAPAPAMLALYRSAAGTCPGLPPAVLAAIGTVESSNGTSNLPGVHSGANAAGAEGPMQFEPATFAEYAEPVPPGGAEPPSPYDPVDAVYAAAPACCAPTARPAAATWPRPCSPTTTPPTTSARC